MNELYTVNAMGQMEINFESLILKTNQEMVAEIKKDLQEDSDTKIIAIHENKSNIRVVVSNKYDSSVSVYSYCKWDIEHQKGGYDYFTMPKDLIIDSAVALGGVR